MKVIDQLVLQTFFRRLKIHLRQLLPPGRSKQPGTMRKLCREAERRAIVETRMIHGMDLQRS